MRTISLDLPYRGKRQYIHGTDLYNAMAAQLASGGMEGDGAITFTIAIHHFARHAVDLVLSAEPVPSNLPGLVASFRSSIGVNGWMVETDRSVNTRVPFAEEEIAAAAVIEDKTARMVRPSGYPPIDVLVILTKHWHETVMPDAGKRWIFVKLELRRLLQSTDADHLSIRVDQNLAGRMTRAIVSVADESIGHIFFSKIAA